MSMSHAAKLRVYIVTDFCTEYGHAIFMGGPFFLKEAAEAFVSKHKHEHPGIQIEIYEETENGESREIWGSELIAHDNPHRR